MSVSIIKSVEATATNLQPYSRKVGHSSMMKSTGSSGVVLPSNGASSSAYDIGVIYFPGWKNNAPGAPSALPWVPIQTLAPNRQPVQGYYAEGQVSVMETQLSQMQYAGIKWMAMDYYWDNGQEFLYHASDALFQATNRGDIKFLLFWANHGTAPTSLVDFDNMVDNWISRYFSKSYYKKIDGVPLVMVFSIEDLEQAATLFGYTVKQLFDRANQRVFNAGLGGVKFVGSAVSSNPYYTTAGCSALSIYNFHYNSLNTLAHSYQELDEGYRVIWNRIFTTATMPYITPMTAGWDKTPWGGWSGDPLHDQCQSTASSFKNHMLAAKSYMDTFPDVSLKMGLICAWNELGEGSYVEPTVERGNTYLDAIKEVFG